MTQRLFHVGLKIEETRLWDLLDSIEKIGAGDVEIHHVPLAAVHTVALDSVDTTTRLALPDVQPAPAKKIHGTNLRKVLGAMPDKETTSPRFLAGPTGLTPKQVAMALYILTVKGHVKRIAIGEYVRVTP